LIQTLDSNFKNILQAVKKLVKSSNDDNIKVIKSKKNLNQSTLNKDLTASKVKIRRPKYDNSMI